MTTAIVLGAGGVTGVAWTVGVVAGLARAGFSITDNAACLVGTSAGSVVSARVCIGDPVEVLVQEQLTVEPSRGLSAYFAGIDPKLLADLFGVWSSTPRMNESVARRIGEMAIAAAPQDVEEWVERTGGWLPGPEWPDERIHIVSVDVATGARVVWRHDDGVDIRRAMSASCAIPGLVPPVPIGEARYMDGGVWSSTNADVVLDMPVDDVIVTCPQAGGGALRDVSVGALERERAVLEEGGKRTFAITPGPAYAEFGVNHMSSRTKARAVEIGLEDGEAAGQLLRTEGFAAV